MKNIKPTGLKGKDKFNRVKDIMNKITPINEAITNSSLELVKKGPDNIIYGIVRENHSYFIKTTNKESNDNLIAEDFNYIGGLENKIDERYPSYADALKHLNLKFNMLNEQYEIKDNTNLFESDLNRMKELMITEACGEKHSVSEMEEEEIELDEEDKYVLKVDAPEKEVADNDFGDIDLEDEEEEDFEELSEPEELDSDEDFEDDEFDEDIEGDDPIKYIQKLTGKLGQKIRELEEVDLELEKYVINSIISATHTDEMSEGDIKDIISKIKDNEDEESDEDAEVAPEEDVEIGDETPEEEVEPKEPEEFEESINDIDEVIKEETLKALKKVLNEGCSCDMTEETDEDIEDVVDIDDEITFSPETKPTVKPDVKPSKPSRRSKPWNPPKIDPETSPKPKAKDH